MYIDWTRYYRPSPGFILLFEVKGLQLFQIIGYYQHVFALGDQQISLIFCTPIFAICKAAEATVMVTWVKVQTIRGNERTREDSLHCWVISWPRSFTSCRRAACYKTFTRLSKVVWPFKVAGYYILDESDGLIFHASRLRRNHQLVLFFNLYNFYG